MALPMAKMTVKNQLTLPKAVVEALGNPSHFRVQVHKDALILWPARLVTARDHAARLATDEATLRAAKDWKQAEMARLVGEDGMDGGGGQGK